MRRPDLGLRPQQRRELVVVLAHRAAEDEHVRPEQRMACSAGIRSRARSRPGSRASPRCARARKPSARHRRRACWMMPELGVGHELAVREQRRADAGAEREHDDGAPRVARPRPTSSRRCPAASASLRNTVGHAERHRWRARRRPCRSSRDRRSRRCARRCASRRSGRRSPPPRAGGSCCASTATVLHHFVGRGRFRRGHVRDRRSRARRVVTSTSPPLMEEPPTSMPRRFIVRFAQERSGRTPRPPAPSARRAGAPFPAAPSARRPRSRTASTTPTISVASALISGVTPSRTLEKIIIGSVLVDGPAAKARDHQIIQRQREGQQPARHDRRRDDRQRDQQEHLRSAARPGPSPPPRATRPSSKAETARPR